MTTTTPNSPTGEASSVTPDFTDLECYLSLLTRPVALDASRAEHRAHAAARRILTALYRHETEVLCIPGHTPGERRENAFWAEVDRAAASESPSVRMVARTVTHRIADHERRLIGDNSVLAEDGDEFDVVFGPREGGDVETLRQTGDLTALLDAIDDVEDHASEPPPAG